MKEFFPLKGDVTVSLCQTVNGCRLYAYARFQVVQFRSPHIWLLSALAVWGDESLNPTQEMLEEACRMVKIAPSELDGKEPAKSHTVTSMASELGHFSGIKGYFFPSGVCTNFSQYDLIQSNQPTE